MSGVTMAGEMAGTLAYMPPEQLAQLSRRQTAVRHLRRWYDCVQPVDG